MSEAIRKLPRRQREMFDLLYLAGPVPLANVSAHNKIFINRLARKGMARVVDLPGKGPHAFARFALRPGDHGRLDRRDGPTIDLIRVGKTSLTVRRTKGPHKAYNDVFSGPAFKIEPHRFIYVCSPERKRS